MTKHEAIIMNSKLANFAKLETAKTLATIKSSTTLSQRSKLC